MGIFDKLKAKRYSKQKAAQFLVTTAIGRVEPFIEFYLPGICEDLGISIVDCNVGEIRSELTALQMWATLKALEGDDAELLAAIRDEFLSSFIKGLEGSQLGPVEVSEVFCQRCELYDRVWDDASGSNQAIWATNVLAVLLNNGKVEKKLLNLFAAHTIQIFTFETMQIVLDARKKIAGIVTLKGRKQ